LGYNRDKAGLDMFWLRDESFKDPIAFSILTFLPRKSSKPSKPPLKQFREIATDLRKESAEPAKK